MIYLYYIVFAGNIGLFNYPSDYLKDALNAALFFPTIVFYLMGSRKAATSRFSTFVTLSWLIFSVYYGALLAYDERSVVSRWSTLMSLRELYPYYFFFYTVSMLTTRKKIRQFVFVGIAFAIVGGTMAIAQSIYGPHPMFLSKLYNLGHWEGQMGTMIGPVARVMLPTLYWIEAVFIALVSFFVVNRDVKVLPTIVFLAVPVVLSFARSQWLGIALCVLIIHLLIWRYTKRGSWKYLGSSVLGLMLITASIALVLSFFSQATQEQLYFRILAGMEEFTYESGTYGSRLATTNVGIVTWLTHPWFGNGPFYMWNTGWFQLSDVGYIYTLNTIGGIGLMLILLVFILNAGYGIKTLREGEASKNPLQFNNGLALICVVIFLFVAQQLTTLYFCVSVLATFSGYTVASNSIYEREAKKHLDS